MDIRGTIMICEGEGEGEGEEVTNLYIGEEVGNCEGPATRIAVDTLEGTNLCADGTPNAITALVATIEGEGRLIHAPGCYMDNLVGEIVVGMLERPRHESFIAELREAGVQIYLISDDDVGVGVTALDPDMGVDGAAQMMVGGDVDRVLTTTDLAEGNFMLSATGVTPWALLKRVRYRRGYALTDFIIMRHNSGTTRRIVIVHRRADVYEFCRRA